MSRLSGRTAVVTGAASGLGRAIAVRFADEGAHVVISDVRTDPIWAPEGDKSTSDLIASRGGESKYVQADVSSADDVNRLIEDAHDVNGRVDVLVNSAAIFDSDEILETSEEDWDRLMHVNLRGQFLLCKAAISGMRSQEMDATGTRGRIVNLSSQHGMIGPPAFCGYAVSKAGVAQLTRQLAVDYAKDGIIVNAVAPGRVLTGTHPGEREYLETGEADPGIEYSLSRTPFPRLGRPEDVAGAALFLASDDCTYISGHNLLVDGGWMAY